MTADSDYYRFVACSNPACLLRFPGVDGVPCPLCKGETRRVADRACADTDSSSGKRSQRMPLDLLLDNVRSVFNVGSIFRSADGCGVGRLYLCGITSTPEHPAMKKTALGAERDLPWSQHNNAVLLAEALRNEGRELWALEHSAGSTNIFEANSDRPKEALILVLGNEVTGVDPGVMAQCTRTVHIPMHGNKASLNVATAMGIAGYALS